jgi:hypothetical protein
MAIENIVKDMPATELLLLRMLAGGYRPGRGMVTVKNNDWKIMIEKQRPEIPIENTDRKYRSKIPIETFTSQNID